jgi:hypothetical protein
MMDANVFKGISSTGMDSVEDQCCSREGHKSFSKGVMIGLHPFLDPVTLFPNWFCRVDAQVEV